MHTSISIQVQKISLLFPFSYFNTMTKFQKDGMGRNSIFSNVYLGFTIFHRGISIDLNDKVNCHNIFIK